MPGVAQRLYVSAHDALRHGDQTIELRSRDVMTLVREHYALADALREVKRCAGSHTIQDAYIEPDCGFGHMFMIATRALAALEERST